MVVCFLQKKNGFWYKHSALATCMFFQNACRSSSEQNTGLFGLFCYRTYLIKVVGESSTFFYITKYLHTSGGCGDSGLDIISIALFTLSSPPRRSGVSSLLLATRSTFSMQLNFSFSCFTPDFSSSESKTKNIYISKTYGP